MNNLSTLVTKVRLPFKYDYTCISQAELNNINEMVNSKQCCTIAISFLDNEIECLQIKSLENTEESQRFLLTMVFNKACLES